MTATQSNPRILIVTPEVTYLPDNMGNIANYLKAKAGGMADKSSRPSGLRLARKDISKFLNRSNRGTCTWAICGGCTKTGRMQPTA